MTGCTKTLTLTSASAVCTYLSSDGPNKKLVTNYVDPPSSLNNSLASEVATLALNIGFDNYDPGFATASANLQNLYIVSGPFMGWTVLQLYNEAAKKLGGCASSYDPTVLEDNVEAVNYNYQDGTADQGFLSCTVVRVADAASPNEPSMKLYPNPTNGQFIIELQFADNVSGNADVQIVNTLGQTVFVDQSAIVDGSLTDEVKLDGAFASGNYFVRVIVGDKVYTGKIIYQQ